MFLISLEGGTNIKTGGEHIFRLVEAPRGSFTYGKTGIAALLFAVTEARVIL